MTGTSTEPDRSSSACAKPAPANFGDSSELELSVFTGRTPERRPRVSHLRIGRSPSVAPSRCKIQIEHASPCRRRPCRHHLRFDDDPARPVTHAAFGPTPIVLARKAAWNFAPRPARRSRRLSLWRSVTTQCAARIATGTCDRATDLLRHKVRRKERAQAPSGKKKLAQE